MTDRPAAARVVPLGPLLAAIGYTPGPDESWTTDPGQLLDHRVAAGWGEVAAVPRLRGAGGWDIVIRLDGTYSDERDAVSMADWWAGLLVNALGRGGPLDESAPAAAPPDE